MAAVDIYVNETTRHADVILPPTTALERDHYDLVFHLLAVRNTARFTPAVFEKEPDQRHDWEVFREITLRTAARLDRKAPLKKRLVQRARLTASPTFLIGQLLRRGSSGVTLAKLRRRPAGIDLGPLRGGQLPDRLPARSKRVDLAPALVVEDVARLARVPAPAADELVLIGRRHQRDCNSWMHNSERLTRGRPRHQLLMNPDDLAQRAIEDGSRVRVTSRVGSVEVEVAASDDLMPGVVSLPHGYGHAGDGVLMSRSREVPGVSDQRPHRPRAARRVGQRRAQRRTRRRHRGLTRVVRDERTPGSEVRGSVRHGRRGVVRHSPRQDREHVGRGLRRVEGGDAGVVGEHAGEGLQHGQVVVTRTGDAHDELGRACRSSRWRRRSGRTRSRCGGSAPSPRWCRAGWRARCP